MSSVTLPYSDKWGVIQKTATALGVAAGMLKAIHPTPVQ
jgi:hypothetical protein